jgi:hypothetical protein
VFFMYISLFILPTYGRVLQKCVSHFRFWKIVEDTDTERRPSSRSFSWFFKCAKCLSTDTHDLDLKSHPKDCLVIFSWPAWESNLQCQDYKSCTLSNWAMRAGWQCSFRAGMYPVNCISICRSVLLIIINFLASQVYVII